MLLLGALVQAPAPPPLDGGYWHSSTISEGSLVEPPGPTDVLTAPQPAPGSPPKTPGTLFSSCILELAGLVIHGPFFPRCPLTADYADPGLPCPPAIIHGSAVESRALLVWWLRGVPSLQTGSQRHCPTFLVAPNPDSGCHQLRMKQVTAAESDSGPCGESPGVAESAPHPWLVALWRRSPCRPTGEG